ncbi:hypothetical protein EVAR_17111_1 [Eumeta japonica]|uniref:Uncharacterized protein n=1 Tax=Eumeta variegata TaxID=151549 RepID=A0A4C1ULU4_EUMVA|nr:hypothetical protein EVAR_17111_1 [Eumeta japonica]
MIRSGPLGFFGSTLRADVFYAFTQLIATDRSYFRHLITDTNLLSPADVEKEGYVRVPEAVCARDHRDENNQQTFPGASFAFENEKIKVLPSKIISQAVDFKTKLQRTFPLSYCDFKHSKRRTVGY